MLYELNKFSFDLEKSKYQQGMSLVVFYGDVLISPQSKWCSVSEHKLPGVDIDPMFVVNIDKSPYFVVQIDQKPDGWHDINLRDLYDHSEKMFLVISRAKQLVLWKQQHKFCGQCGHKNIDIHYEPATQCTKCSLRFYPKICPCVIVLIVKEGKILLAKNKRNVNATYGAIAGFIEVGESVEQAVHREVLEETNLQIKNLTYLNSQTWPFPNQLMLGFIAEYESGELQFDKRELMDANWFDVSDLPNIPPAYTIAGWLIRQYQQLTLNHKQD